MIYLDQTELWMSFCSSSAVVRATEMSSTAKSCRGAGGSSGWSRFLRPASMSSTIFCFWEWRRCTSGTRAYSRSRWAAQVTEGGLERRRRWLSQLWAWVLCPPQVLKHVGSETIVTHEVSAQAAGNLIGQRDFVCVRHSRKHKSAVYLSGAAIQLESLPPLAGFVRYRQQDIQHIFMELCESESKGCSSSLHPCMSNVV